MTIFVAVNPSAGSGLAGRAWPRLSQKLHEVLGSHDFSFAEAPGDITVQVRKACNAGATSIIAMGGDGTINEAVNGLALDDGDISPEVTLGIIPVGTGSDFARTFAIPQDPFAAIEALARARRRTIDLGKVSFIDDDGRAETRLFANIASLGISGLINRELHTATAKRHLPGSVSYYLATVRGLMRYRFQRVSVSIDDRPPFETDIAIVAIANCRYFGGGMMIAPDAEPDDGIFDIVILKGTSKAVLLRDLRLVYGGRHRDHPSITITRGTSVRVEPAGENAGQPVLLDTDGEAPGRLPATFEILPRALNLFC